MRPSRFRDHGSRMPLGLTAGAQRSGQGNFLARADTGPRDLCRRCVNRYPPGVGAQAQRLLAVPIATAGKACGIDAQALQVPLELRAMHVQEAGRGRDVASGALQGSFQQRTRQRGPLPLPQTCG